jgi:DNA (cytosine-5)-methyltransferase 1
MGRIQTFPDGLVFDCSRTEIQRMIGNAVPSLLAEALAREIRRQLLGHRSRWSDPRLLPPRRSPVPAPEPVARVAAEYRKQVGEHADHPGEGMGARARQRAADKRSDHRAEAAV